MSSRCARAGEGEERDEGARWYKGRESGRSVAGVEGRVWTSSTSLDAHETLYVSFTTNMRVSRDAGVDPEGEGGGTGREELGRVVL